MVTGIISAGAVTNNFGNYRLLIKKCVRSKTPKALFASFRYHGQKLTLWQPMGICRIIAFFCHIVNKNQKYSMDIAPGTGRTNVFVNDVQVSGSAYPGICLQTLLAKLLWHYIPYISQMNS